jgi:hypothetical protein
MCSAREDATEQGKVFTVTIRWVRHPAKLDVSTRPSGAGAGGSVAELDGTPLTDLWLLLTKHKDDDDVALVEAERKRACLQARQPVSAYLYFGGLWPLLL